MTHTASPPHEAAREIERLATTDVTEDRFFARLLDQTAAVTSAIAGAVWMLDGAGRIGLLAEQGLTEAGLSGDRTATQQNLALVADALQAGQPVVHVPGGSGHRELPTDHVLLMVPVRFRDRVLGVIEHFLPAHASPESHLEHLQFLEESAVLAKRYLEWRDEASSADRQVDFWMGFERFVSDLHRSLNPMEVAATAVNDGRVLLGCDRVSLVLRRGARTDVVAVSGQDRVRRRSNLVRAMRTLAKPIIRAGQTLTYTGGEDDIPPSLVRPLTEFVRESNSRLVRLIPLIEPAVLMPGERREALAQQPRRCFGALVVERTTDGWLTPPAARQTDLLAEHVATALHNARTHHGIFLLPMWKGLGRLAGSLHGRTFWQLFAVLVLLTALVCGLAVVPAEYRVEGSGQLMPVVRREVFAPWDGEVVEVAVTDGQRVQKGDILVRLRNDQLNTQLLDARNKLSEKQQLVATLKAGIDAANRSAQRDEEIRLRGRYAQTVVEIRGLTDTIDALTRQVDSLTLRAPLDGTVATFQIEQLLVNRPIARGEKLLEVMDEGGPWQLELQVPERRMGHLLAAQALTNDQPLVVDFVLATDPEHTHEGTLHRIATRTGVSVDDGTVVDVQVAVNAAELTDRRIGADVRGKIRCGEKSLFYVLFGDVVEFVQARWW